MEAINRSKAKEISKRVQETLESLSKELHVEFKVGSCRFGSDSISIRIEGKLLSEDGDVVVSPDTYFMANNLASDAGISCKGNFLGSVWLVDEKFYAVTDVRPKNRKYPCIVRDERGRSLKCSFGHIKKGTQVFFPTEKEFIIWCTINPDEDSVKESDVEIYDRVEGYVCTAYTQKDGDDIISIIESANEKLSGKERRDFIKNFYKALTVSAYKAIEEFSNVLQK